VTATHRAASTANGACSTVYLLHFDQRYEHAGHYTGIALDLDARLAAHVAGKGPRDGGARLIQVIRQAGIGFRLARTWPGGTRGLERRLKNQGGASRRCPICKEQRREQDRAQRTVQHHAQRAGAGQVRGQRRQAHRQPTSTTVRPQPDPVAAFLTLNPAFARPVSASPAKQWGRVRGREDVELHGPRVTGARFEENEQPSQHRVNAVTRRAVAARVQARQQRAADQAERDRPGALLERTRRQLKVARDRQAHRPTRGGRQAARDDARQEADRER
jgi:hypothetical protein